MIHSLKVPLKPLSFWKLFHKMLLHCNFFSDFYPMCSVSSLVQLSGRNRFGPAWTLAWLYKSLSSCESVPQFDLNHIQSKYKYLCTTIVLLVLAFKPKTFAKIHLAWPFTILQIDNITISWDFFRLTAPRCPSMAAGAVSLRKISWYRNIILL